MNQFLQAHEYTIRVLTNFFENSWRYSQLKVHHWCRDTGGKWKKSLIIKCLIILFGHLWEVELTYRYSFCLQVHFKVLVARCHSFYLFLHNLSRHTISYIYYSLSTTLVLLIAIRSVESLLWGAEPRFEPGPAVQQAGALLSEPHRTLNLSHTAPYLSHTAPFKVSAAWYCSH